MFDWFLNSWRLRISVAVIVAILIFLGIYFGVVVPGTDNATNAGPGVYTAP
jgi:Mg/Co/Ni transporter MgtE